MYQDGVGRAGLLVCHPCGADGRFDVVGVFNVPQEQLLSFDAFACMQISL